MRKSLLRIVAGLSFALLTGVAAADLSIASFNIKFLGYSDTRDNAGLARALSRHDIVFVQELVSPPIQGLFPDGTSYQVDPESREFFIEMAKQGYHYWLSEEDTGPGQSNHKNSSATEWFVAFYRPGGVTPNTANISGFIAADRTANDIFSRVPYAFSFKDNQTGMDFVIVSAHLQPGDKPVERERRNREIMGMLEWVERNSQKERDYILLGDFNTYRCDDLNELIRRYQYVSANTTCMGTNLGRNKPYDQVIYNSQHTRVTDFNVVDLHKIFGGREMSYQKFIQTYSDHHPIRFRLETSADQDN